MQKHSSWPVQLNYLALLPEPTEINEMASNSSLYPLIGIAVTHAAKLDPLCCYKKILSIIKLKFTKYHTEINAGE